MAVGSNPGRYLNCRRQIAGSGTSIGPTLHEYSPESIKFIL